ncbi:hypothetical protein BDF21DRAFT_422899 [Thamnidium elegans]|uniref:G-patch domain-containing protein n=1 Tax=Thamnidium elegans TaxID=101142 RepID=A0A8H7SH23_9FUNG|nr:hypothetical protein INT48_004211 [Thamnidium elegans]KAI8076256.1 hypothetical protein BDF21DRAFT_422899 [Thamnidium elegans]
MTEQHNFEEKEQPYSPIIPPRTIVSKYSRPIEFISEGSTLPEKDTKKPKITSNGNEIASFYRSIISASSKPDNSKNNNEKPKPGNSKNSSNEKLSTEETWWCESCSMSILKSDYKRHIQGTAHMVCSKSEPVPDMLGLSGKNLGFKMLRSQGWKYEEGLGPKGQGRRHPIATVLKQDRLCIGHGESGRKVVTHKYKEIEKKAIDRQRREAANQRDPGKEIARKHKEETARRVAILKYMKD